MYIDKEYNPFKHIHGRIDIIEKHLIQIKKRLDMPEPQKELTVNMICDKYHLSKGTIYNHMKQGNLKGYKIGAKRLFKSKDVDKWIATLNL